VNPRRPRRDALYILNLGRIVACLCCGRLEFALAVHPCEGFSNRPPGDPRNFWGADFSFSVYEGIGAIKFAASKKSCVILPE